VTYVVHVSAWPCPSNIDGDKEGDGTCFRTCGFADLLFRERERERERERGSV